MVAVVAGSPLRPACLGDREQLAATAGTPLLTRAAARMLAEPSFRAAAGRIRDVYATVDGPGNAADAVMELTAQRSPV